MNKGTLYLIPNVISEQTEHSVISTQVREVVSNLKFYLVENVRTARRYISKLELGLNIEELRFEVLDKNTSDTNVSDIMSPALAGEDIGIISESGCPGVADPGAKAVSFAHKNDITVVPLSGPSSILMALMASGFNGQSFVFHGYLPIDKVARRNKIKLMESSAIKLQQTQIFMDTPYRNQKLFDEIITVCNKSTKLSIGRDITGTKEFIATKNIHEWSENRPDLNKIPVIFSLFC